MISFRRGLRAPHPLLRRQRRTKRDALAGALEFFRAHSTRFQVETIADVTTEVIDAFMEFASYHQHLGMD